MSNEITLKPCPFCGGKARYIYSKPVNVVACRECGATGAMISDWYEERDGKNKAIDAWNRRAENG